MPLGDRLERRAVEALAGRPAELERLEAFVSLFPEQNKDSHVLPTPVPELSKSEPDVQKSAATIR